jgi:hypothetical protein
MHVRKHPGLFRSTDEEDVLEGGKSGAEIGHLPLVEGSGRDQYFAIPDTQALPDRFRTESRKEGTKYTAVF